jgi:hypothetical protein
MIMRTRLLTRLLRIIFVPIITIIGICIGTLPVSALEAGHSGTLNPEVQQGSSYTQLLEIGLSENEPETDVYIQILSYNEINGKPEPIQNEDENILFSARPFIEPTDIVLHCKPGEKKRVKINIQIPAKIKSGGRYAIIRFATAPLGANTNSTLNSAIVLPLRITVNGEGALVHTGEMGTISCEKTQNGKPIIINTLFTNTGNHHYDIKGTIEIRDKSDKLIDVLFVNNASPIPLCTKNILTTFVPKEDLPPGKYYLQERLTLEDGTLLDKAEGEFEIMEVYVPPTPPAEVILKPGILSLLKTEDGRITIEFPKGSVLGETRVSLLSYLPEQLPIPPQRYSIADTCFRIDGLCGLLVKPATLKVQYSNLDLKKAAYDPSRLTLARWDEASLQWTIFKTSNDSKTQTLTIVTDHFSLWTIMAVPPQSGFKIIYYLAGVIILATVSFILIKIFKTKS